MHYYFTVVSSQQFLRRTQCYHRSIPQCCVRSQISQLYGSTTSEKPLSADDLPTKLYRHDDIGLCDFRFPYTYIYWELDHPNCAYIILHTATHMLVIFTSDTPWDRFMQQWSVSKSSVQCLRILRRFTNGYGKRCVALYKQPRFTDTLQIYH